MRLLEGLTSPADVRGLDAEQVSTLAEEVREFLIGSVCRTGGHLGPNLGVVELTLALHRSFESPRTPLIFDTGHQAYVHKLLTGRLAGFSRLRSAGGLSGYPSRAESVHDVVENSHASTALSYADGLSKQLMIAGDIDRPVVAVIGDGALTGGMAWEALNNIGSSGRRVIVVLNDNGRSYSPTVGGFARHLAGLREHALYRELAERLGGSATGSAGRTADGAEEAEPGTFFGTLGFGYVGPVDGHDVNALETALGRARASRGPTVVHCLTTKGRGYTPAESDDADRMHAVGVVRADTGRPAQSPSQTWTDAFADCLVSLGTDRPEIVAVSAAMLGPTGMQRFADRFPSRCFDVGIAEQHAITSAAGLAMGGAHPVVALYATFANRAFDQTLLDVGLHRLAVTLVLDRSGVTGPDGPSHHGMWDLAMLAIVPGMRIAAPRDPGTLVDELGESVDTDDGPTAIRFPKAKLGSPVPAVARRGAIDVLRDRQGADVLIVAVGVMAEAALAAADELETDGIVCTVVDPRWVIPVDPALAPLGGAHRLVVTVEDGVREGGVGTRIAQLVDDAGLHVPVRTLGLPTEFLPHGSRTELLAHYGLDGPGIAASVRAALGQASPRPGRLRLVPRHNSVLA
ncbi:MAG TPA: 1-deoxy-D-xylulose-5-phosphate synthase [Nocardioidaceae bacterium]|nr:1-deoxy-D-xylulose-5-phosphate synthase [Nocardioidaceae bacterium]